ncbi:hypothetical protein AB0J84_02665 [Micromonospora arborensis]|uniref:hypothetical protein n=1 Tax=Micromonospora arborensis TaxID=2116518 RepID=UPI003449BE66
MPSSDLPVWVTLAAAGIGVAGAMAGSGLQAFRDDRRWERERKRERERWDREDQNRWFSLKTERYAAFLKVINDWGNKLFYPQLHPAPNEDGPALEQQADQEMSNLMFFATKEIRRQAADLWEIMQSATAALTEENGEKPEKERIKELLTDSELWRKPFREAEPDDDFQAVIEKHYLDRWASCAAAMRSDLNVPQ